MISKFTLQTSSRPFTQPCIQNAASRTAKRVRPITQVVPLQLAFLPVTGCDEGGFYSTGVRSQSCIPIYQPAVAAESRFASQLQLQVVAAPPTRARLEDLLPSLFKKNKPVEAPAPAVVPTPELAPPAAPPSAVVDEVHPPTLDFSIPPETPIVQIPEIKVEEPVAPVVPEVETPAEEPLLEAKATPQGQEIVPAQAEAEVLITAETPEDAAPSTEPAGEPAPPIEAVENVGTGASSETAGNTTLLESAEKVAEEAIDSGPVPTPAKDTILAPSAE